MAVFLFCLLYFLLLAVAIGLSVGGLYGGLTLLSLNASVLTVMAGAGLIVGGVLFFAFFIKCMVAVNRSPHPYGIEVTAEEQPRLYEFIKQLANDTHAPRPRKVFLVPGVDVAIGYHSRFWNLFWPVRKHLKIGLGLVNVLSVGEFKAMLAHEFGYFSRRDMTLGSYLYTVNRILYQLVYDDDRQDQYLDKRVAAGGIFAPLAIVIRGMVTGVRLLLRGAYALVNKQYLGLSREIEFHADGVATRVAGHKAMISALRKADLGARADEQCTDSLNQLAKLGKKTEDRYANQRTMLMRLASRYELAIEHGLPRMLDGEWAENPLKSRITIKDQWASHLSRREREQHILTLPVAVEHYSHPAWKLFKNLTTLRRDATLRWYEADGAMDASFQVLSATDFANYVKQEAEKYQLSPAYHGFYEGRFLQRFDLEKMIAAQGESDNLTFEMVYNQAHYKEIARFFTNQEDAETLRHIQAGAISVGSFEFDHQKCAINDVGRLVRLLNGDLARQKRWLTELDQQAFLCHYRQARQAGVVAEYIARYRMLMSLQEAYRNFSTNQHQLTYWQNQQGAQATHTNQQVCELTEELSSVEVSFKSYWRACGAVKIIHSKLTQARQQELIPYLRSEQMYYLKMSEFDEEALLRFTHLVFDVWDATRLAYRQSLKSLTEYQLGLRVAEETRMLAPLQVQD